MKKICHLLNIAIFCVSFCLLLCLPVYGGSAASRVYDLYDVLSEDEEEKLNQELQAMYDSYGFEAVILTSEDILEDERMYAAEFMQENGIGYGEEKDGMCLFNQPGCRNITVVFRGDAQHTFDTDIQDMLLDDCTKYLKQGDYYGAYNAVLQDMKGGLKRWAQGKSVRPMDISGESIPGFAVKAFLFSLAVMAVPVLLMTLYQRGKMKTFVQQSNADAYMQRDGVHLNARQDTYIRTMRTRTAKPSDDSHSGGGSGSFTSGGESFSGSSRNY